MSDEEVENLYDEESARDITVILLMRLYDVAMVQLMADHPEEHDKLFNVHAQGGFFNPPIMYNPLMQLGVVDTADDE